MKILCKLSSLILICCMCFAACEEVIELPLQAAAPVLVIEGAVTNLELQQEVFVSQTQPFYSDIRKKPLSGAEVFLNENHGPWMRLKEEEAGRYIISDLRGKPGSTYGMRVQYGSEIYEAESKMPELVRIDSTGVSVNILDNSRKSPLVLFQDPPGIKNYYYFQLEINNVINSSLFIYNDKYNDGKSTLENLDDFSLELKPADRVIIELRNIDENSYNYWRGVQSQTGTSASPGNPPSNISNGALGLFSAYSANSVFFDVD